MSMMPELLLWDFGDTLVDERWMRRCPEAWPGWEDAWAAVMAESADDWNVGAVRAQEIFAALSRRTGMTLQDVEAHARDCCQRIVFNAAARVVGIQGRRPPG